MRFDFLRGRLRPSRVAEVGWLLQTDHSMFMWAAPKPLTRQASGPRHPKSVVYCPAVIDYESRFFEILCPFDLQLRVISRDKLEPQLVIADDSTTSVEPNALGRLAFLSPRCQWRHPDRPLLQFRTPYTFVADEPVYVNQLGPILHYRGSEWPGLVLGGRLPVHIWPRRLAWAFEWYDTSKDLILSHGEPWFYCRFETQDASRGIRLVEAQLTPELKTYLAGINGVVNYVNRTFSLFPIAQQRRPKRLLVKIRRDGQRTEPAVA